MTEFSPSTLESRGRSEYTILFGKIPIYRSSWNYYMHPLVEYLQAEGIVAPIDEPTKRHWHQLSHWNYAWRDGYSGLYYEFRNAEGTIEWCKEDRARADYYFAELFRLLRSDCYLDHWTADQMSHARRFRNISGDLDELKREVARTRVYVLGEYTSELEDGNQTFPEEVKNRLKHELAQAYRTADFEAE